MGILRIMSVGRSGVGKSTIGNMLLFGEGEGRFLTSTGSEPCTRDVKELASFDGSCVYTDVPGLPDTHPENTAKFYDVIIREAKKELNVILFVFKRDRIDRNAYKLAEMLFRELNKSNAVKVLVINDHNNYRSRKPPSEDEYEEQVETITKITKVDFEYTLILTGETMKENLEVLKIFMSETKSYKSEHIKTFGELKMYVNSLILKKNYEEEVIRLKRKRIASIKQRIMHYKAISIVAEVGATAATIASVFTFGAALPIALPCAVIGAAAFMGIQKNKKKLEKAKDMINLENMTEASLELEEACEEFIKLKDALNMN